MSDHTFLLIYRLLYEHFGPRHWWPAETPFEVMVGAILTQNIAWKNVEKGIAHLKTAGVLSPEGMLETPVEELAELIRPTGYYNMKAKKLQALSHFFLKNYGGSLEEMFQRPMWPLREELLSIYGVGRETADCILLYAGNMPVFVIDAYTKRIFSRLGLVDPEYDYDQVQQIFMANLPTDVELYNEYHALIVALGNALCANKPKKCHQCPLLALCPHGNTIISERTRRTDNGKENHFRGRDVQ